jgi:hypothetical protein
MIYALLSHPEAVHFRDLYEGSGQFRMAVESSPAEKRERSIVALESVLPTEKVREQVGNDEVWIEGRGSRPERWRRL